MSGEKDTPASAPGLLQTLASDRAPEKLVTIPGAKALAIATENGYLRAALFVRQEADRHRAVGGLFTPLFVKYLEELADCIATLGRRNEP